MYVRGCATPKMVSDTGENIAMAGLRICGIVRGAEVRRHSNIVRVERSANAVYDHTGITVHRTERSRSFIYHEKAI